MQPDLPEPVVPAMRMCGMRERSVQIGVAGDVLAEPDRERARGLREVVEDVSERDEVRRCVRDLDADGLLAGDRSEDANLRRGERVREIVLQRRDLRDLRAGCQLELVARDARPRDLADDGRVDTEVRERRDERLGDLRARLGRGLARRGRAPEHGSIRKAICLGGDLGRVEERRLRVFPTGVGLALDHLDGCLREIRVVVDAVHEGRRRTAGCFERDDLGELRLPPLARSAADVLHRTVRAPDDGPHGGAREQEQPREQRERAEDEDARGAEQPAERRLEPRPQVAAVCVSEHEQQAERRDCETQAERPYVDEPAPHERQPADAHARDRNDVDGRAHELLEPRRQPAADDAGVPSSVEDRCEKQAERHQREPDQLGVVMATRARLPLLASADARRRLRTQPRWTLLARHGGEFVRRRELPA